MKFHDTTLNKFVIPPLISSCCGLASPQLKYEQTKFNANFAPGSKTMELFNQQLFQSACKKVSKGGGGVANI